IGGDFALASAFNQSRAAVISAHATANATGFSALANATGVGVGQLAVALAPEGVAIANVTNEGLINAVADAHATSAFSATANALAIGVGQEAVASNASAFVFNHGKD